MARSNYVHLSECRLKRLTDKAALVIYDGAEYWLPLSQMADGEADKLEGVEPGERFTLSISQWIASEKGIEGDED